MVLLVRFAVVCTALAGLLTATLAASPAAAGTGPWVWPLPEAPDIVRPFDPPPQRWLPGHRGVDLAAPVGGDVRAAGAGRVSFAGFVARTGVVAVTHGDRRTTYLPVIPAVTRGDAVSAGDPIGTLAAEPRHCPNRSCLHWGLRDGRRYADPLALVGRGGIRLLPTRTGPKDTPPGATRPLLQGVSGSDRRRSARRRGVPSPCNRRGP